MINLLFHSYKIFRSVDITSVCTMPKHKKSKKVMSNDSKHKLKFSMKGSWYNQEHRKDDQGLSVSSRTSET